MKKQQTIKFGVTVLSLLVLTACGGGSGGSSSAEPSASINDQPATSEQSNTTLPVAPTSPENIPIDQNTPIEKEMQYHGQGFQYTNRKTENDSLTPSNVSNLTVSSSNLNTIVVDGKTLNIIPSIAGITGGTIAIKTVWQGDNYMSICCGTNTNIKSVKTGFVKDPDTGIVYAFYNGLVTPETNIPTSGNVVYGGDKTAQLFTLSNGVQGPIASGDGVLSQVVTGNIEITANFSEKTINGKLYENEGYEPLILLDGKINSADITGTASLNINDEAIKQLQVADNLTAPLTGAFFGQNAEEVAGEAHNSKWGVIFAAEKQQ